MNRLPSLIVLCLLLLPVQGCAPMLGSTVPMAADAMAEQMDKQICIRFGDAGEGNRSTSHDRALRARLTIMATVPVDINNFEVSCPLARQMSEEMARWLVNAGYKFQELRKGREIFFQQRQGEMILTRDTKLLASRTLSSEAILTGTYVVTPEQVRFSMRLIHTPSNEVLAMSTATVPLTADVRPLLANTAAGPVKIAPSTGTKLQ